MLRRARVALLSPSRHLQEQLRAVPRLCGESERIGPSREASVGACVCNASRCKSWRLLPS